MQAKAELLDDIEAMLRAREHKKQQHTTQTAGTGVDGGVGNGSDTASSASSSSSSAPSAVLHKNILAYILEDQACWVRASSSL